MSNRLRLPVALAAFGLLAGCVEPAVAPSNRAAAPQPAGDPRYFGVAERDRVLFEYRNAVASLRAGNFDDAKTQLDDALLRIGGVISGPDEAARRSRGLFTAEREKIFIGEP